MIDLKPWISGLKPRFYPIDSIQILLPLLKIHTHRIDAIANASLIFWTIGKAVPEVPATVGAEDFFADHEVAVVHLHLDGLRADRFGKAGPTATAVILFG